MSARPWTGGELRREVWTGEWAVVAPARADRPREVVTRCPFCPGPHEDTASERWRMPAEDGPGWRVRSVRNRYAVSDHHEVIIESPRHDWDPALATVAEVTDVLAAWQQRHRALRAGAVEVVVFRNKGAAAGVSLTHPHSQVVGLPVLPAATARQIHVAEEHYRTHGRPIAEDILATELAHGERVLFDDKAVTAFVPLAPAADFEVRLAPGVHRADFAAVPHDELTEVAGGLRAILAALRTSLHDPAYSLILHTAPTAWTTSPCLCWYLRVVPRLSTPAGLELATGIPVLTVRPEVAAARLRAALPGPTPHGQGRTSLVPPGAPPHAGVTNTVGGAHR